MVWFTVRRRPSLLIVAVFVPLLGAAMRPLKEPVVVADVVERLIRLAVPAPVFGLLTVSGPVVAPIEPPVPTVRVPAETVVPPL